MPTVCRQEMSFFSRVRQQINDHRFWGTEDPPPDEGDTHSGGDEQPGSGFPVPISNGRDYQARRGMIRVKREDGRTEYVHTLNGSGLATSRIFPALVEQNQNADGSVTVPEVLRKYIGLDVIKK